MPIINNLGGNEIEILKLADFLTGVEHDITDVYFGDLQVFTVWAETEGALPLTISANGENLIDYKIYGNTVQDGTPTPQNPIAPSGCGEKTENLWDDDAVVLKRWITNTGAIDTNNQYGCCMTNRMFVSEGETVTFMAYGTGFRSMAFAVYDENDTFIRREFITSLATSAYTYQNGDKYIVVYVASQADITASVLAKLQPLIVKNATAPTSYIPYGYKLPLTSAGQGVDIYLGEAETTRRIKKLVLTGQEYWKTSSESKPYISVSNYIESIWGTTATLSVCSHFSSSLKSDTVGEYNLGGLTQILSSRWNGNVVFNPGMSTTDFKSYLAAQYAAGTPVTVWYVVETPETGIVNEPLMKIGDYADTLSMEQAGVSIPTLDGTTVIDFDNSPKPSKMYVKYRKHGT